nr:NAD(P)-dependent oxidoreductase [uncultured Blautia sp.]
MRLIDSNIYKRDLQRALKNVDLSQLKNKSIIITGGLGLIGSAIVDLLLASDVATSIYILGRNIEKFNAKYNNIGNVFFISYDALKPVKLDVYADYVICCAGLASPELYVKKPVETMLSNMLGMQEILRYCKEKSVKRILYISSSEVYGRKETETPFIEGNYGMVNIDDIRASYAVAKRSAELLCKSYFSEYGLETVIVRPGHIYGPSASTDDKRISSDFAYKAANGKKLEMKSAGLQKRSYCYSIDCAVAIMTVLLYGQAGEAYNVGHSEITTIKEMASILATAGNVALITVDPTIEELTAFNPMNNATLDDKKIQGLGYKETFSVEEGLTHTVQILKELKEERYK